MPPFEAHGEKGFSRTWCHLLIASSPGVAQLFLPLGKWLRCAVKAPLRDESPQPFAVRHCGWRPRAPPGAAPEPRGGLTSAPWRHSAGLQKWPRPWGGASWGRSPLADCPQLLMRGSRPPGTRRAAQAFGAVCASSPALLCPGRAERRPHGPGVDGADPGPGPAGRGAAVSCRRRRGRYVDAGERPRCRVVSVITTRSRRARLVRGGRAGGPRHDPEPGRVGGPGGPRSRADRRRPELCLLGSRCEAGAVALL